METRIIKAVFGASKSVIAPKRYKHDYGQEIEFVGINLPDVFEAHFSNSKSGQAKKQIGQDNKVLVPDEYFVSGADIFCWVMVHDEATVKAAKSAYYAQLSANYANANPNRIMTAVTMEIANGQQILKESIGGFPEVNIVETED